MHTANVHLDDLPTTDTDVLVVGAGPTGLMAGLVLARCGVAAVVVDRKEGTTRESRALAVQARSVEVYDQLGLAGQVLAGGESALRLQIGESTRRVNLEQFQAGWTRFPGVHIFEQSRNEQLLQQALHEAGHEVRWCHRLLDLLDTTLGDPQGRVVALLEGPDGLVRVRARWCIGADGARSTVRRILDLPFDGVTDDATFWVADVHAVSGAADDTVAFRFGQATFAVAFPLGPGGHVRFVGLAQRDDVDEEAAMASIRAEFGLTHGPVDWFSTYRVHHRVAARFRAGACFLAGDAAHVHSPVGGQGMNTGLQDAHDLALLLADVVHGRVSVHALVRYERERRPVARHLVSVTDRAFGVVGRRGPVTALLRRRVASVAAVAYPRIGASPLGVRIGGYLGQYRIRYRYTNPADPAPAWAADRAVGLRLPPVGDNDELLRAMTWQLHTYGATGVTRPDLPAWIEGPHTLIADEKKRLSPDRLYLVRPDGFVAASFRLREGAADTAGVRSAAASHFLTT